MANGPLPDYQESGGRQWEDGFSMAAEYGPFNLGNPETYARRKANLFPGEGGPVLLIVDVPYSITEIALSDLFDINEGLIQFDYGYGIEELRAQWPQLSKEVRKLP